ncbi:MAG: hypothetical protein LIP03_13430 [Bacteroidales bacterium]|nr:hypothetical protein [Bacteroidales bacterium]
MTTDELKFQYIWSVIGYRKEMLLNWGIDPNTIKQIPNGTSFNTKSGNVEVTVDYDTDLFCVRKSGIVSSEVTLSQLPYAIDELVNAKEAMIA